MQLSATTLERLPMVWFLVGLLLNSVAVFLGFDHPAAFVAMILGWFSCAFGVALFAFKLMERPKQSDKTRLSPNFISAGATTVMPAPPKPESAPSGQPEAQ